jgi:teichuronic acid biosynthesis glycosyltransferase TuaG
MTITKECHNELLVSVILPVYNGEKYLSRCIESVLSQDVPFELIIANDASTDNSISIIEKHIKEDDRVSLINLSCNSGVSAARNAAIGYAKGLYVAFIDSDDFWVDDKLKIQMSQMQSKGWRLSYCDFLRVSDLGMVINSVSPVGMVTLQTMLSNNSISTSSACILTSIAKEIKFKDTGHEDYIFWMDALNLVGQGFKVVSNKPLMMYSVNQNSLSGNKIKAIFWQWKNLRVNLNLPLHKSVYFFSMYLIKAIHKRL